MKNLYKQKREQGFTIIEVMIVLAIAAVILLIVLLAVPALQRNSRNTQRSNDAAQLAAAVNTCLANHNGDTTSAVCKSLGVNNVDYDLTKLGQFTGATFGVGTGSTTNANWAFGQDCAATTNLMTGSSSAKAVAIAWKDEASGGGNTQRCISG
jgi:prepilin-type N-terminal cleavage/methylation domain-containing protein